MGSAGKNFLETKVKRNLVKRRDKNIKYFHKMANAKARRNFLSKIRVNGVNLSSLEDIKEGVCSAYQSLLSVSGEWRPSINDLNFRSWVKAWPAA